MTPVRRGVAGGMLAVSLLASCATPTASDSPRVVAFDDAGLRVSLPAGWDAMRSGAAGVASDRVLFYLSNQALHADCRPGEREGACPLPVDGLSDGGVLLLWATAPCAGIACELPRGDRRLISGREAAAAPRTGMCDPIGATNEEVFAVAVTPQRVDWIVICARSPGDEEREAVASILDGVDWRTP